MRNNETVLVELSSELFVVLCRKTDCALCEPVMRAFCPLLFESNNQQRGKCNRAGDCGSCNLLWGYVKKMTDEGWKLSWECHECIKQTHRQNKAEKLGVEFSLPGYYQGTKYDADGNVVDPDSLFDGCYRCGFGTSLLQIIFRRGENIGLLTAKRGD